MITKKKKFGLQYLENHPAKKWNYSSVKRLLKKSREISSMDERHGSGRPKTVFMEKTTTWI